ncbi:trafficking protein particle complex subunit 2, putative [Phytophthora infestans T30-4]|uniref:Trafficking protein particle complex subunit 2, putative n=17 Tax=Phytophthora TaxID=4783 RepID=D0NBZ3_PHYIT|nr:trafficking protein particle complex subunit 2, putative [Phytophthora infestans T30-4]XP_008911205.1 hypothetical protein PPTG_15669 [Phytophthora nicotianae INRA-310]ETI38016.1 hypothetical protein F443_16117 [Phytophthora nicotianae P1569]ETK78230.1 hypothetical protein L915_15663 [Phytophthora nicotianae]ETO66785.1 hypothetical protein F444_16102 [Phytophthora nicotianae P1976]ETP07906.1 hypothetical protein F441_15946 [Phytophthora nicotianae CJ01A1]ETP35973.1 hypothetical protein F44|eukprot:XP_002903083.1 trafficking protein particle complex subunit 2, putative [Phytophthora infestans T30-4]
MSMFVVVGSKEPLYKMEMRARREESAHVDEFVLHAALDLVDELMWTTPAMALKVVDRFNDQLVSAFVTASGVKFLLLHETRNDDTVKAFFHEVHELYVKLLMNPFYEYDTPISSEVFDARVKTLARRYL